MAPKQLVEIGHQQLVRAPYRVFIEAAGINVLVPKIDRAFSGKSGGAGKSSQSTTASQQQQDTVP